MTVYCRTTLNYAVSMADGETQAVEVALNDGRADEEARDFDACGFTLLNHPSTVTDWTDEQELNSVHRDEIETIVIDQIGCDAALIFPAIVRSPRTAKTEADYAPIEFVHSDFTDDYGPMVTDPDRPYRLFLDALLMSGSVTATDLANASRLAVIQFWRNTGAERPDRPLAFCDARSVDRSDLIAQRVSEYAGRRLEFETFGVRPPQPANKHQWTTYPGLCADEVVMLRTYDSARAESGEPFWTPHSAFVDPNAGAGAPRRESVEMRALCVWSG